MMFDSLFFLLGPVGTATALFALLATSAGTLALVASGHAPTRARARARA